ncbi:MAG: hypothetical protein LBM16_05690 [Clostridiales bacterium]|nr:hypothetical protein [Clostridiales bacterium]
MTEKSKNTRKYILRLTLLTALLAVPGLTVIIIRFILGDIGRLKFAILLIGDISTDMCMSLVIISFYYLYKFTSANPSYKNYSTKSKLNYVKFFIILWAVCYILKLLFYIFMTDKMTFPTFYYVGCYVCGLPGTSIVSPIVLSDKNLYICSSWLTYSIDKIKLDNLDEIARANIRYDDYVNLQFHYDDKEVKARIKRKNMMELRAIMER